MQYFKITVNGTDMGEWQGTDADAAILLYINAAGYETSAQAADACGQTEDEFLANIVVEENQVKQYMVYDGNQMKSAFSGKSPTEAVQAFADVFRGGNTDGLSAVCITATEDEFGCDYCRNDGKLSSNGVCPKCDAQY